MPQYLPRGNVRPRRVPITTLTHELHVKLFSGKYLDFKTPVLLGTFRPPKTQTFRTFKISFGTSSYNVVRLPR